MTVTQASREIAFQATSFADATSKLMAQWGATLGVAQAVVDKIVTDYEAKQNIIHIAGEQQSYRFTLPVPTYHLAVASK